MSFEFSRETGTVQIVMNDSYVRTDWDCTSGEMATQIREGCSTGREGGAELSRRHGGGVCFLASPGTKEIEMRIRASLFVTVAILMAGGAAAAQQAAPAAAAPAASSAPDMSPVANPVTGTVKAQLARFSKNMVAAAQSMPAEKYGFKP